MSSVAHSAPLQSRSIRFVFLVATLGGLVCFAIRETGLRSPETQIAGMGVFVGSMPWPLIALRLPTSIAFPIRLVTHYAATALGFGLNIAAATLLVSFVVDNLRTTRPREFPRTLIAIPATALCVGLAFPIVLGLGGYLSGGFLGSVVFPIFLPSLIAWTTTAHVGMLTIGSRLMFRFPQARSSENLRRMVFTTLPFVAVFSIWANLKAVA